MVLLFHYLSLLNIFDAVITYFGLENSYIQEMNPLMSSVYAADPSCLFLQSWHFRYAFTCLFYLKKYQPHPLYGD